MPLNRWDGSSWVDVPKSAFAWWDGSAWQEPVQGYWWDGTNWMGIWPLTAWLVGTEFDKVLTTPDNGDWADWALQDLPVDGAGEDITFAQDLFVSVGGWAGILTSPNGLDWTQRSPGFSFHKYSIEWTGDLGLFTVGTDTNGAVLTSPDGLTWTERSTPVDARVTGFAWSPSLGLLVASVFDHLMSSPDAVNWTQRYTQSGDTFQGAAWSPDAALFVAVGNSGITARSSDGINWTRDDTAWSHLNDVTFAQGLFVAVGNDGVITSTDGDNWTQRWDATGTTFALRSVEWFAGLGLFVAGGDDRALVTSPDGITWTVRRTGTIGSAISGIAYSATATRHRQVFDYTGAVQQFRVPDGVTRIHVGCYGPDSGGAASGGWVWGGLDVAAGDLFDVYVGGQGGTAGGSGGFNGGGAAQGTDAGDGAGGTDLRPAGGALADRLLVAGGAGGDSATGDAGGAGGGTSGADGAGQDPGAGGTQTAGGAGGSGATDGSFGEGGDGAAAAALSEGGGGGGGGWYGGGGGGASDLGGDGGGGGGSGYLDSSAVYGDVRSDESEHTGHGRVEIHWSA